MGAMIHVFQVKCLHPMDHSDAGRVEGDRLVHLSEHLLEASPKALRSRRGSAIDGLASRGRRPGSGAEPEVAGVKAGPSPESPLEWPRQRGDRMVARSPLLEESPSSAAQGSG